jgi:hypothetical protein
LILTVKEKIPSEQHLVLELQEDGKLITSDDPPIVSGGLEPWTVNSYGNQTCDQGTFSSLLLR